MKRMNKNLMLGAGAALLLVGASLPAFAASSQPSTSTTPSSSAKTTKNHKNEFWQHELGPLGTLTGLSKTQLQADVKNGDTFADVLKQANMTQKQFSQKLHAAHVFSAGKKKFQAQHLRFLAAALKLSPKTLKSDLQKHETVAQIAKAQGVSMKELHRRVKNEMRSARIGRFIFGETAKALKVSPKTLQSDIHNKTAKDLLSKNSLSLTQLQSQVTTSVNAKIKNQARQKAVDTRIQKMLSHIFG